MSYQQPYPSTPAAGGQQTHTMSIVSLVAAILGLCFGCFLIGPIVAIITGNSAQKEIQSKPEQYTPTSASLARAGTIVGWVGLGLQILAACAYGAYFAYSLFAASSSSYNLVLRLIA
jgi:hypothetical protein